MLTSFESPLPKVSGEFRLGLKVTREPELELEVCWLELELEVWSRLLDGVEKLGPV